MIVVKLQGGLGNQMFQYALGRALSLKKNTELLFDISSFTTDPLRTYSLSLFAIDGNIATESQIKVFKKNKRKTGKLSFFHNLFIANWKKYVSERMFHFDSEVFTVSKNAYLDGYWNTEKYFRDIRETLLTDFTLKNSLSGKNKEIADKISTSNSVSIHIRRGDYAHDIKTKTTHGLLSSEYYTKGCDYIAKNVTDPILFIFSDDIAWVKNNLSFPFQANYIDWNAENRAYEDMRLMSLCKHHIIANSTFSWWGAWLSTNPNKIVIGPKKWFNQVKQNVDTKDLLPESWIKL